jgi:NAD(P)-dependent dehydrogenase (short-subunit alcohol dehydrogenase family)
MPSASITGANRGIGLEFAKQYLADGWRVYATCRDPNSASELRQLADKSGDKLRILALNVTDPASVKAAAAELDGQAIDLLLNNAGVGGVRGQTIGNIDYEAWAKVLDANTMGPCGFQKLLLTAWHEASASLSSPLPAGWDRLPTTPLEALSPIAAQRRL